MAADFFCHSDFLEIALRLGSAAAATFGVNLALYARSFAAKRDRASSQSIVFLQTLATTATATLRERE